MPKDARRIIEVGCSGGGLAREYRPTNPGCEYIGIEINDTYAKVAREHCTRVLVDDIEHMGRGLARNAIGVDLNDGHRAGMKYITVSDQPSL